MEKKHGKMEIKAPIFRESIADGSVAQWHHQPGEFVARDTLLVDIETDKVVIEVFAPEDGACKDPQKRRRKRYCQTSRLPTLSPVRGLQATAQQQRR